MRARYRTRPPQPSAEVPWDQGPPVRGMDGRVPIHNMPTDVAVFLYNLSPSEYGCRTREGTRTWAQNLAGNEVKTIFPFQGQVGDFSTSRLFCSTQNGIFDVTSLGQDNPAAVVTFADQTDPAGFCSSLHFTDPNGQQVLLVADSLNGMYEYNPIGAIWTKYTTEITFPDSTTPADIVFIMIHKGRIWLIARDAADAYYLPVGAKGGAASKFQFGSKMSRGGFLVSLVNWSIDGGDGIDDYLIATAKGGDVLVYRGSDPATASQWSLVGRWFIGPPPEQRRNAVELGGDTILLSTFGITSAGALLKGIDPTRVDKNVMGNITRLIRDAIQAKKDLDYWELRSLPEEGILLVNSPKLPGERHIQFTLNLNKIGDSEGGWGLWRDVPATTFETYNGSIYFGTEDGRVMIMQGSLDEVDINGNGGNRVTFSALTGYTNGQSPGIFKQVHFIRPEFISNNVVSVASQAYYDFNLQETNLAPGALPAAGSFWDTALWDQAIWSGTFSSATVSGGVGYGKEFAVYLEGSTAARATLVKIGGTFEKWSFL